VLGGHTSRRHTCHKQSPTIVRSPVLEDRELRGGKEGTRGESKRMLSWQLQNCPRTDGKHASEEKRENENERKSADHVVTDMMTYS